MTMVEKIDILDRKYSAMLESRISNATLDSKLRFNKEDVIFLNESYQKIKRKIRKEGCRGLLEIERKVISIYHGIDSIEYFVLGINRKGERDYSKVNLCNPDIKVGGRIHFRY
jgi:hypothetical protein